MRIIVLESGKTAQISRLEKGILMKNLRSASWDKSKVLILSGREIREMLRMDEVLEVVERSFKLEAEGKAIMPPKLYLNLPQYRGDFRAMPAYIDGVAGVKWVSSYPSNPSRNLRSVVATIILCDPETSYPLAIMDGTYITTLRTGATGGVAVKYLQRGFVCRWHDWGWCSG